MASGEWLLATRYFAIRYFALFAIRPSLFPRVEDVFQFAFRQVSRIEDVPQLLARQAVQPGVIRIEFGAYPCPARVVPDKWGEWR